MMRDPAFMESIKNDPIYQKIMVRRRGREGESAGEVSSGGGHTLIILFLQQPPTTKSEAPKQQQQQQQQQQQRQQRHETATPQEEKGSKRTCSVCGKPNAKKCSKCMGVAYLHPSLSSLLPPPSSLLFSSSPLPLLLLLLSIFLFPFTSSDIVV